MSRPTKRDLPALREWLRLFRARLAKHPRPELRDISYLFLWQGPADEEPSEITEAGFFGQDSADVGHPRAGVYTVRVLSSAEEDADVIEERSGEWTDPGAPTFAEREQTGDSAGWVRTLQASSRQQIHDLHADIARLRATNGQYEERERALREKYAELVTARGELQMELHAAQLERDEAFYQAEQAEAREEAALEELAVMRRRGGELAPVATSAVKALFDRGIEQFLGEPPLAAEREAIEEAQAEITIALLRNLPNALSLVHAGILPWDAVRVAIITAYGADPGETPPPANWTPPEVPDEEEAEHEAESTGEVH